ncbi:hypothetical protein J5N97_015906 [Dioscorea zingiberensis]|uniref:Uncharacterized protein n=1 Tax=Dioscorea zingiberensis TaxID=325984 RepID=A0A9D5CIE4_9LILI|nr:hypothetical protein J5N97_015906 [Dioscorea zingiberensis]
MNSAQGSPHSNQDMEEDAQDKGSAWTVLSRSFAECRILGWDNLPRTLLLYYTNFISLPVVCNSDEYKNTTVNHDLHYIAWDEPPKQHPLSYSLRGSSRGMIRELLQWGKGQFSYGGWCSGGKNGKCSGSIVEDNMGELRPGQGSRRLKALQTKLLSPRNFKRRQCR